MAKYAEPVSSLLAFLINISHESTYGYSLSGEINNQIKKLQHALQVHTDTSHAIHTVLCSIWFSKWHRTPGNLFPCPTDRLLAYLTLNADGTHKQPFETTQYFAKFQYCMRLTGLKQIKQLAKFSYDNDDELAFDSLQQWFSEKTNCPFAHIRSLQHRASSIAYQTTSLPQLWWTDPDNWTELVFKGDRIHLDGLRGMFQVQGQTIVDIWEKKILMGLVKTRVSYNSLADDLTNNSMGYSFLTDKRNISLQDPDLLGKAFLSDPSISATFGHTHNGHFIWNTNALREWLRDYAIFQGQLLLRCETLSGAPGRGTELTALLLVFKSPVQSGFLAKNEATGLKPVLETLGIFQDRNRTV
jgi:hypothetical protein